MAPSSDPVNTGCSGTVGATSTTPQYYTPCSEANRQSRNVVADGPVGTRRRADGGAFARLSSGLDVRGCSGRGSPLISLRFART